MRKIVKSLEAYPGFYLILLVLIGILNRAFFSFPLQGFAPQSDFQSYFECARDLSQGKLSEYIFYKGPGICPIYAAAFAVAEPAFAAWFFVNVFLLLPLGCVGFYLLVRELTKSPIWALAGVLLLVLLPDYREAAHFPANENAVIPAVSFFLWAYFRMLQNTTVVRSIVAGVIFGLSFYVKALFALASPILALFVILNYSARWPYVSIDLGLRFRRLLCALLFGLSTLCVVAPWWIYTKHAHGKPIYSMAYYGPLVFWTGNQPYGDRGWGRALRELPNLIHEPHNGEHKDPGALMEFSLKYMAHHPTHFVRDLGSNFKEEFYYNGSFIHHWKAAVGKLHGVTFHKDISRCFYLLLTIFSLGGFLFGFGRVPSGTAVALRFLYFYLKIFFTMILVMSIDRHKMAAIPLWLVSAVLFMRALQEDRRALWIFAGQKTASFLRELRHGLASFAVQHRFALGSGFLALVVALALRSALDPRTYVGVRNFVGGNAMVFSSGRIARPYSVVAADPGPLTVTQPFKAVFKFHIPQAGRYALSAIYSRRDHIPVSVWLNERRLEIPGFHYYFGGRANRFAQKKLLGSVDVSAGDQELKIETDEACPGSPCGPVIQEIVFEPLP